MLGSTADAYLSPIYPGPSTTFTFEDGSESTSSNLAYILANFTGVVAGPSFYEKFCTADGDAAGAAIAASSESDIASFQLEGDAASGQISFGYPPGPRMANGSFAGWYLSDYLEDPGVADVAVLGVSGFEDGPIFQGALETYLNQAKADGKTKMIIDLQGNGGGLILLGYELFRQLFPNIVQGGNTRWRTLSR